MVITNGLHNNFLNNVTIVQTDVVQNGTTGNNLCSNVRLTSRALKKMKRHSKRLFDARGPSVLPAEQQGSAQAHGMVLPDA